jgi:hypothetical protein
MIVSLDGQPIRTHADAACHVDRTTLQFIDVRAGQPRSVEVILRAGKPHGAAAHREWRLLLWVRRRLRDAHSICP